MNTLYHYCTNEAFLSILESRSIRLSSLTLSNDSMEGKVISHTIERLAKADRLSVEAITHIQKSIAMFNDICDGLGFCLSEDGDLLSQWRGYSADGNGVSIGFSKDYLDWLSKKILSSEEVSGFVLHQVQYENHQHEDEVRPTYAKVKQLIEDGALKTVYGSLLDIRTEEEIAAERKATGEKFEKLMYSFLNLLPSLFTLKTAAFKEEREWRLVSFFVRTLKDGCSFRALNNRIVPYRTYELVTEPATPQAITDVILGPRNITPEVVVHDVLLAHGFENVNVRRSTATYR